MPQIITLKNGQKISADDPNYSEYQKNPDNVVSNVDAPTTPIEQKPTVTYNNDGTRTINPIDKYWQDHPVTTDTQFVEQQNATKADFAKRQQEAIDSINNMYVSILAKADQTGKDKLGSANVINALSGNRGSASGAAAIDKVNSANDEIYKGILAEKQNKINSIISQYYKDQTDELRYQNDLRRQDLDKYLTYLGSKESENLSKSKAMRADLIASNIKMEDIAPDVLQRMADSAGYSVDQFKALYDAERKAKEKEFLNNENKRLADLEKTKAETEKLKSEADPFDKQMITKGYIPVKSENDLKGLTENDIIRVADRIYRKPPDKLDEYEAKKKIDAKYKTSSKTSTQKNYNDTTIPGDLKKEIVQNIGAGAKVEEVISAYPEVSSKYIQSLYTKKSGRTL